jgi:glycerol kinase
MTRKNQFILNIDYSTLATKVMLFDVYASLVHRLSYPHQQYYPAGDFIEQNPMEIFENTVKGMTEILRVKGIKATDFVVVSIKNQLRLTE